MSKMKRLLIALCALTVCVGSSATLTACDGLPDSIGSALGSLLPDQEIENPDDGGESEEEGGEDGNETPQEHVHSWGSWTMLTAPTCETAGSMQRVCTLDSTHIETETVTALGHDLTDFEGKSATCTAVGWKAYSTCSRCDYSTYEKIFELGHSYGEDGLCGCGAVDLEEFFTFELSSDGTYYEIFEYVGDATTVNCPEKYKGLPVKVISESAFVSRSLESVFIPKTITKIGDSAFENCASLKEVTVGSGVTEIGNAAFKNCASLTTVVLGDNVTKIGDKAFFNCLVLKNIELPNSLISIGTSSFYQCSALESLTFPNSLISIGNNAFIYCYKLKNVELPKSVVKLGADSFSSNACTVYEDGYYLGNEENPYRVFLKPKTSRKSFTLHENTKVIAANAFAYDVNLTKIVIPDSVTDINEGAFWSCTNLQSVELGENVKAIESSTFYGCSSLTSVVIPSSVTEIGRMAFSNCTSLASVVIGESVTLIEGNAFYGCTNLESVTFKNPNGWTANGIEISAGDLSNTEWLLNYIKCNSHVYWQRVEE